MRRDARADEALHRAEKEARIAQFELETLDDSGRLRIEGDRPRQFDVADTEDREDPASAPEAAERRTVGVSDRLVLARALRRRGSS